MVASVLDPNKAYEYAHVGLYVMCTRSLTTILETLKNNCSTFEDYETLMSQLEYFKNNPDVLYNKRREIFEFAQANLIWERNEKDIFRAYQIADTLCKALGSIFRFREADYTRKNISNAKI